MKRTQKLNVYIYVRVKDDRIGERVENRHEQDERDTHHVRLDINDDVPFVQHLVDVNVDIGKYKKQYCRFPIKREELISS